MLELRYLEFSTKEEALERSQELWESVIGRPVKEGETTKYLFGEVIHPNQNRLGAKAALEIPQEARYTDRLRTLERTSQKLGTLMRVEGWDI